MFVPFGLGQVAQEATDERAHVAVKACLIS
jgi:hypothetical protein